jgi:hypothetical protein
MCRGYNAQAVCNENRSSWPRRSTPTRRISATSIRWSAPPNASSPGAGVAAAPAVVVADAGYWHHDQIDAVASRGIRVLIARRRQTQRCPAGWEGGRYAFMCRVLETELGRQLYGKRQVTIEPVFANTKFNRRIDRFLRRGRSACRSEWRLITATHNLLTLHRNQNALATN